MPGEASFWGQGASWTKARPPIHYALYYNDTKCSRCRWSASPTSTGLGPPDQFGLPPIIELFLSPTCATSLNDFSNTMRNTACTTNNHSKNDTYQFSAMFYCQDCDDIYGVNIFRCLDVQITGSGTLANYGVCTLRLDRHCAPLRSANPSTCPGCSSLASECPHRTSWPVAHVFWRMIGP